VDEEETVALDCDDGVTLVWGSCELPEGAFFAFFSFSLFNRTSLAEAFLCMTHIKLMVQEWKNVRLTRWP
jgi:hypothetical protein